MECTSAQWFPLSVCLDGCEVMVLNPDGTIYARWDLIEQAAARMALNDAAPHENVAQDKMQEAPVPVMAHFLLALRDKRWADSRKALTLPGVRSFLSSQVLMLSVQSPAAPHTNNSAPAMLGDSA